MQNILIIEDDSDILKMLSDVLSDEGYAVSSAEDGKKGIEQFVSGQYDLVLLDIMLPKRNGIEVMEEIRKQSFVPIMIISAKGEEFDKSIALGLGADDYLTKPFSLVELKARVKALLRRASQYAGTKEEKPNERLLFRNLSMDIENYTVEKQGKAIKLTAKEFELLKLFLQHPNRVYTKEQLYSLIWDDAYFGDENIVNVHISRLRNKIEDDARNPEYIQTLWGIGYRLGETDD